MTKETEEQNLKRQKTPIKIAMTTEEYYITGEIYLPIPSVVDNPTSENLLFYALNCGNKFIQLFNCIITSRNNIEYKPELVDCYNINLDIVHSCKIIKD